MEQGRLETDQAMRLLWADLESASRHVSSSFWHMTNAFSRMVVLDDRATGFKEDGDILLRADALLDVYRWQIGAMKAMRDQVNVGDDITLARADRNAEGMGVQLDRLMFKGKTGA